MPDISNEPIGLGLNREPVINSSNDDTVRFWWQSPLDTNDEAKEVITNSNGDSLTIHENCIAVNFSNGQPPSYDEVVR